MPRREPVPHNSYECFLKSFQYGDEKSQNGQKRYNGKRHDTNTVPAFCFAAFCFAFGVAAASTRATSRHEVYLEIANSWPSALPLGPQLPPPELTSNIVRYAQIRRHEHEPNLVLLCCSWLLLGGGLQLQGAAITHGRKNKSRAEGTCLLLYWSLRLQGAVIVHGKKEGRAERRPSSFSPTLVGTERT